MEVFDRNKVKQQTKSIPLRNCCATSTAKPELVIEFSSFQKCVTESNCDILSCLMLSYTNVDKTFPKLLSSCYEVGKIFSESRMNIYSFVKQQDGKISVKHINNNKET